MANENHFDYQTGNTLYILIRNSAGQVNIVAGDTFENYTAANIATYINTVTENGDGGGHYVGDFNANITTPGVYHLQAFLQSGASPADGDDIVGDGEVIWTGTAEVTLSSINTLIAAMQLDVTKTYDIVVIIDNLTEASGDGDLAAILADTDAINALAEAGGDGDLHAILHDTGTTIPAQLDSMSGATFSTSTDSLEAIRNRGDAAWEDASAGTGLITFTYTLYTNESEATGPIANASVWVTTDEAGATVVASGVTNSSGAVVFYLDSGDYYVWRQCAGYNFTNPDTETVA